MLIARLIMDKPCPRCGGPVSESIARWPEKAGCLPCGWREYVPWRGRVWSGKRMLVRLPYRGGVAKSRAEAGAMKVWIKPSKMDALVSDMPLEVQCPICRSENRYGIDMELECPRQEFWKCERGHRVRVWRKKKGELIGWS